MRNHSNNGHKANCAQRAFFINGKYDVFLIVAFIFINGIVFYNALFHDPRVGYDAPNHLSYIRALSKFHLVSPEESYEFFSPPLPYILPACLLAWTPMDLFSAAKMAQLVNGFLSLGVIFFLLRCCDKIVPESRIKRGAIASLGMFPFYYKTFAFVRGEPYIVFFVVLILYCVTDILRKGYFEKSRMAYLGILLGLLVLSRQWGFFVALSLFCFWVVLFLFYRNVLAHLLKRGVCCVIIALCVSSWFYLVLNQRYGNAMAFNRSPEASFSFCNQPLDFYISLNPEKLFSRPVRRAFPNRFAPIFYSDIWGDYWGYFLLYGRDKRTGEYVSGGNLAYAVLRNNVPFWLETNWQRMSAYLGRVNLVSCAPTLLILAALIYGLKSVRSIYRQKKKDLPVKDLSMFLLIIGIVCSFGGYLWFLIMYPNPEKGDTIKATYMIQVLPMVSILVGIFLEVLRVRNRTGYTLGWLSLLLPLGHNFTVFFTRYPL